MHLHTKSGVLVRTLFSWCFTLFMGAHLCTKLGVQGCTLHFFLLGLHNNAPSSALVYVFLFWNFFCFALHLKFCAHSCTMLGVQIHMKSIGWSSIFLIFLFVHYVEVRTSARI